MALSVFPRPFAELLHGVGPCGQSQVLAVFDVRYLSLPGPFGDELSDQLALHFARSFEAVLKALDALAVVKTNQPLVQPPPSPRQRPILRQSLDAELRGLDFDPGRPFGRHALKSLQQMIQLYRIRTQNRKSQRFFIIVLIILAGTFFDRGGQLRPERMRVLFFSLADQILLVLSQV